MSTHEHLMTEALAEAAMGRGAVEPNPMVGAVVSKNGKVISKGYHKRFGAPHAEIEALSAAADEARGATLYVTLEPCSHHGKTPPCADAIIDSGISTVASAMRDPNPVTSGKGYDKLREAGIEVIEDVLRDDADILNAPYIKLITRSMPYVTTKWAMTLDGKIATVTGQSQWISSEEARNQVHEMRGVMDGVMVGINTLLSDNPLLTSRGKGPRKPIRIVADSRARTPIDCKLLKTLDEGDVLIAVASNADKAQVQQLEDAGAEVLVTSQKGRTDLKELFSYLGSRNMTNVLVEGGGTLLASLFEQDLVDKAMVFVSPKIFGGIGSPGPVGGKGVDLVRNALLFEEMSVGHAGPDIFLEGRTRKR